MDITDEQPRDLQISDGSQCGGYYHLFMSEEQQYCRREVEQHRGLRRHKIPSGVSFDNFLLSIYRFFFPPLHCVRIRRSLGFPLTCVFFSVQMVYTVLSWLSHWINIEMTKEYRQRFENILNIIIQIYVNPKNNVSEN